MSEISKCFGFSLGELLRLFNGHQVRKENLNNQSLKEDRGLDPTVLTFQGSCDNALPLETVVKAEIMMAVNKFGDQGFAQSVVGQTL